VLLSVKDGRWKLSDFGTASRATSSRLQTTNDGRGTSSYRAPEVVSQFRYHQKSDIFALGCILYEVITGQRLFADDYQVRLHGTGKRQISPDLWPPASRESVLYKLGELAGRLISAQAGDRPSALEVLKHLGKIQSENIRCTGAGSGDSAEGEVDSLTSSTPATEPVSVLSPQTTV
jgi:eukaryotic-like serine/threonine-protein kinase